MVISRTKSLLRKNFEDKKKDVKGRRSQTKKIMRKHYAYYLVKMCSNFNFLESPRYFEVYEMRTRHQKKDNAKKRKRTMLPEDFLNHELCKKYHHQPTKSKIKEISIQWSENSDFMDSHLFHKIEEIYTTRTNLMQEYIQKKNEKRTRECLNTLKRVGVVKDEIQKYKSVESDNYQSYMLKNIVNWLTMNNYTPENPLPKRIQCQVCFQENERTKQFLNGSIGGVDPQNDQEEEHIHLNCPFKSCPGCLKTYLKTAIDSNRIIIRCPGSHEDGKRCSHNFTPDDIESLISAEYLKKWLETRSSDYQERLDDILASDTPEREFVQTFCKPCPRCRVIVFKDEGCDDMYCTCGTNFCYKCGKINCTCR